MCDKCVYVCKQAGYKHQYYFPLQNKHRLGTLMLQFAHLFFPFYKWYSTQAVTWLPFLLYANLKLGNVRSMLVFGAGMDSKGAGCLTQRLFLILSWPSTD